MNIPDLTVVVLFWNGSSFVDAVLDSVEAQTGCNVELVLVDNGSEDDTVAKLMKRGQGTVVETGRNLGFAGGVNAGIRASQAPIVVLLNQDIVLEPGCLLAVASAFRAEPKLGALGGKLVYPDRITLQHAGGYLQYPLALGQHFGYREHDEGQYDSPRDVEYVNGALIALRRTALDECGLFDEQFWPGYFEEVDLCRRLRIGGWRVLYEPKATAIHLESSSLVRDSDRYFEAYHRNRLRYVLKHYTDAELGAFARAEADRYWTLGLDRERKVLSAVYGETAADLERGRPNALLFIRPLLTLTPYHPTDDQPPERPSVSVDYLPDYEKALEPLGSSWRVIGPPLFPPERRPIPFLLGLVRTASWLVIRWSFLPVLERQDRYNKYVLDALVVLSDRMRAVLPSIEDRAARIEPRTELLEERVLRLRARVDQLQIDAIRNEDSEQLIAAIDRDLTALRKQLGRHRTE